MILEIDIPNSKSCISLTNSKSYFSSIAVWWKINQYRLLFLKNLNLEKLNIDFLGTL